MGDFGDKFRKAREAKNLSLDDVSRVTKIGARMLQAIEEEHFDQLPGGVFNKGFIRAYAKHLGLNDEDAVTDYLCCLRQAQIQANEVREPQPPRVISRPAADPRPPAPRPAAKPQPAPSPQPDKPPSRVEVAEEEVPELQLPRAEHVRPRPEYLTDPYSAIPWRIVAVAAIVVLLAALLWMRHSRVARTEAASTTSKPVPAPTASNPVTTTTSAQTNPTPASPSAVSSTSPKNQPSTASPASTPDATKAASPTQKTPQENDVTVRVPVKPAAAKKSAPSMTLVIRATENTWVSVQADGQLVSQETLIAPANTSVRATREITVRTGNAAGLSFVWNGQQIPAQGAESEAKTLVFDAKGMRVGAQPAQNQ